MSLVSKVLTYDASKVTLRSANDRLAVAKMHIFFGSTSDLTRTSNETHLVGRSTKGGGRNKTTKKKKKRKYLYYETTTIFATPDEGLDTFSAGSEVSEGKHVWIRHNAGSD